MTTLTQNASLFSKVCLFFCSSFHSWCDETAHFSDEEQPSNDWDEAEPGGVSGLLKIIEMAPSTSLHRFCIPKLAANSVSFSKQSFVKCLLHKTGVSDGPVQLALVLCTFFVQIVRKVGSLGNRKQLIFSPGVLEQS